MHPIRQTPPRANQPSAAPQPRWAILSPILLIAGMMVLVYGTATACAPLSGTPTLAPLQPPPEAATSELARLPEMMDTASLQHNTPPLLIPTRLHHASRTGFNQRLAAAAAAHGWLPLPSETALTSPAPMVIPQADLHLLTPLAQSPESTMDSLASAAPRPTSPGPLLTVQVDPDYYWTPSRSSIIFTFTGAAITASSLLVLLLANATTPQPAPTATPPSRR